MPPLQALRLLSHVRKGEYAFRPEYYRCPPHPRFMDKQMSSAVGAIDYVRGSGN